MLKPSDLTKAELLQVVEMLAEAANEYYLDRALGRIEMQRNDAHYARCKKLIDEERRHTEAYFELLRPYDGQPITNIPLDVAKRAQAEWEKARSAGKEWDKLNGIRQKGKKM
jgi:acyl-CoA reductase-like NAD-dependent aldehyde dehydrogenase